MPLLLKSLLHCLLLVEAFSADNFEPVAKEVGPSLCRFLTAKGKLSSKWWELCGLPTCDWNDWTEARQKGKSSKQRIIVSYGHNGFGNQLWQHSVAFMVAEAMQARLFIAMIPTQLSPGGWLPPNTAAGMDAMKRLLPNEFLYDLLPQDSSIRSICDRESFYVADRPVDWRNQSYSQSFDSQFLSLVTDPAPRCLKTLGYFQNYNLCADDIKQLWTPKLFSNYSSAPGPNDISIYLRCVPHHYFFNDENYYESILNHTTFEQVWLFQAPECPKLGEDPTRDGAVAKVLRLLTVKYGAKRWPSYEGTDSASLLLHDLAGLAQSKKVFRTMTALTVK